MRVNSRLGAAVLAACCWITVAIFCIAGVVSNFGNTPDMSRFFYLLLSAAVVLTLTAVLGHILTPLVAGHGIGVRAGYRAGHDGVPPKGRHAAPDDETEAKLYDFRARQ
jgi:uncharacterized membrane protein